MLIKSMLDSKAAKETQAADLTKIKKSLEELSQDIKGLGTSAANDRELIEKYNADTKEALINIIRDRVSQAHAHYKALGHIDTYSLQTMELIYKSYAKTDSNHFVGRLIEELRHLPLSGDNYDNR